MQGLSQMTLLVPCPFSMPRSMDQTSVKYDTKCRVEKKKRGGSKVTGSPLLEGAPKLSTSVEKCSQQA